MSINPKDDFDEIKAILIGDSGVGKTNLINTSVGLNFEEGKKPTISGSFIEKMINIQNKKYQINLWDTAGQEAYRGVTKLFFKGSQIVFLVYDITNHKSFESLNYWITISKEIIENEFIFGLIGNKNDLFLNEEVKEEEANVLAESINSKYKIVSAKTDPERFVAFLTELIIDLKKINLIDENNGKNKVKLKEGKKNRKKCVKCHSGKNKELK